MSYIPPITDSTATVSIAANATSSGSLTTLTNASILTVQLTGTWSATVQIQVQADGSTWTNTTGSNIIINAATGAYVTSGNLTANGIYQMDIGGFAGARVITTAYTSGTVTGTTRASLGTGQVSIDGIPTVNVNGTVPVSGTFYQTTQPVSLTPAASGGFSNYYYGALTTTVQSVKSSAGQLYGWSLGNTGTSGCFVQVFNTATGSVTLGTTAPILSLYLPAGGGNNIMSDTGTPFSTAISVAATTTYNGSTAPSTLPTVNMFYK